MGRAGSREPSRAIHLPERVLNERGPHSTRAKRVERGKKKGERKNGEKQRGCLVSLLPLYHIKHPFAFYNSEQSMNIPELYFPVLPKPPEPRAVDESSGTSQSSGKSTGIMTIWLTLSPRLT